MSPSPLQMEYRNKYYVVVRSHDSDRWNWAVDVDARTVRGGQAVSERAAIRAAERLIDRVIGLPGKGLALVRLCHSGDS
jgi:hypothetical protein